MDEKNGGFFCFWRIENFLLRRQNSDLSLESPNFKARISNAEWSLELCQEEPGFIGIFLYKESNPIAFKATCSFRVLTSCGWTTDSEVHSGRFKVGGDGFGETKLISWQNISNDEWTWLPYGCLTICAHIMTNNTKNKTAQCMIVSRMINGSSELKHLPVQYFTHLKPNSFLNISGPYPIETTEIKRELKTVSTQTMKNMKTESSQTDEISPYKDREDLHRFFKEKDFDFVTLRTINKDFTVHKAVLCAKSPVFNAMFDRIMQENERSLVDIKDIDSETLALLVRYLHFEPLEHLQWEDAVNLYYAADKYQIEQLKETCLIFLKKELSVKTVCEAFVMADLHQDEHFLRSAFEFFYKNSKFILKSDEWKVLLRKKPELASEILEKLADMM